MMRPTTVSALFLVALFCAIGPTWSCRFDPVARVSDRDASSSCGNGVLDQGEECDGADLGGQSCQNRGYVGGDLACSADCHLDYSGCTVPPDCGNGRLDDNEECDDENTQTGDGCSAGCQVESGWECRGTPSTCTPVCGDNTTVGSEICDGTDLQTETCVTQGFAGGILVCKPDCTGFDTSGCTLCGNGILDENEACDDSNSGDGDGCSAGCQVESGWECHGTPSTCTPVCGDGRTVGSEICDGADLRSETCNSQGLTGGTLACQPDCTGFDTSGCYLCGDGICSDSLGETVSACPTDCGFVAISAGGHHTCALRGNGRVWCWGYNGDGRLGDGTSTTHYTPVRVSSLSEVFSISAGRKHSCALDANAVPWCWGNNAYGQVGDGTYSNRYSPVQVSGLSRAEDISAGRWHSCAIDGGGSVWCWGHNNYGQLGDGTRSDSRIPVQVASLSGAVQVSAGGWHSCAVDGNGSVWCWGANWSGQLGNGTSDTATTPV